MAVVDVVAQHGWGFGAWCWDRWRDVLPANFALHCPDRGYFGPAVEVKARPRIVLAHSLGLHLLSSQLCATAELIVVISGFRSFHSASARQARRSRRTVEQMLVRLEREPAALLADFYGRCGVSLKSDSTVSPKSERLSENSGRNPLGAGSPHWIPAFAGMTGYHLDHGATRPKAGFQTASEFAEARWPRAIDVGSLRRDLELLQESVLELSAIPAAAQVLILHGSRDRVVPVERAEELGELLPNSELAIVAEAGHALPLTHVRACWERVERTWCEMQP